MVSVPEAIAMSSGAAELALVGWVCTATAALLLEVPVHGRGRDSGMHYP